MKEGNQNAPSHQLKKKAVKFSQQDTTGRVHTTVWKRKEEGKNSATSWDSTSPACEFFQRRKKKAVYHCDSIPPQMNSSQPLYQLFTKSDFRPPQPTINGGGKDREKNRQRNIAGRGREHHRAIEDAYHYHRKRVLEETERIEGITMISLNIKGLNTENNRKWSVISFNMRLLTWSDWTKRNSTFHTSTTTGLTRPCCRLTVGVGLLLPQKWDWT